MNRVISFISQTPDIIIGSKKDFILENRIFNAAISINLLNCIIAIIWHNTLDLHFFLNIIFGILFLVFSAMYYYSRFKKIFSSTGFVLLSLFSLSFVWFSFEGSKGSTPIIYILAISGFTALFKTKKHYLYLLLTVGHLALMLILENLFYDELIIQYPDPGSRNSDILFTIIMTLLFCFAIIAFIKNNYDAEYITIQKQKKELQILNDTKNKFFSILAHDLRGPYMEMLGLSQIMKDRSNNISKDEFNMFANELEETAQNTHKLLENLLDWGQLQRGVFTTSDTNIQLLPFIFECVREAEIYSTKKNITITMDVPESISMYTDKYTLQAIFRNILSNAIKFSPRGKEIFITTEVKRDHDIIFSVKDNGIGMSKKTIENLFKFDINTKRLGTEGESSTGLGLLLCKEFIEKLGGQIWIKSEEEKGTEIKFSLPSN